jgi:hypothetical protein
MTEYYTDFIGVYENVFSPQYCNKIIDFAQSNIKEKGYKRSFEKEPFREDTSVTLAPILPPEQSDFIHNHLKDCLLLYKIRYKSSLHFFPTDGDKVRITGGLKYQSTSPTQGFHDFHCEYSPWGVDRWAAYTIYLNNIKEGGETEFLNQSIRISPKVGSVCIFPTSYTHVHRGNPPLKDTKHVITGWFNFNGEISRD